MKVSGLFGIGEHLKRLSETGDPLETLAKIIDFEAFRPVLDAGLGYSDGSKGGRPPYDPVVMFKVLILAAQNNVSDERMEFLIRDRLSWLRFLGFGLGDRTPDENTIRLFRERLTRAGAIEKLFEEFDRQLKTSGYLAMGGQIVDASLIAAPRQRNTVAEKAQVKAGLKARDIWKDEPNKAAQKDTDARWTGEDRPASRPHGRALGARTCHRGVRLQDPCGDRPHFRLHPQLGCHQRFPARRRGAARNRHDAGKRPA